MSSSFGSRFRVTLFGESHGPAIGAVIEGVTPGLRLEEEYIRAYCARRLARGAYSTARHEPDLPRVVSGAVDGVACGTPLTVVIENTSTRSGDYGPQSRIARPGHADYTGHLRYDGFNDVRGGGHFSGRLTAPLVYAGAVASLMLRRQGVAIGAHAAEIAGVTDTPFDPVSVGPREFDALHGRDFPVLDPAAGEGMQAAIAAARADCDSVGGVVECAVTGLPAGVGDPFFDTLESRLAYLLFAIPAVKGVEFGAGFSAARMRGSESNDPFVSEGGRIRTSRNAAGGIQGGISNGMPILFRAAFKPTPSIAKPQQTVNFVTGEALTAEIRGRHDPCIVPRAAVCVEAAAAIALADLLG
ncbi:chorismate synthase [Bittarella massiliensis (ex Durand et al. 2017)]|uniref:chorismate synthase n=1 Tax=Bittarella massiliensis (ex Durand et al. 2017) TaxID=1720313 RepID=UPI001AA0F4D9|nr:chorismate synthase [Bittarella massiliensis (ex Durand et al. 2017)]MBO1679181.1 chorismate synthase [Bittarella massiliensis (ex Durand et al. 2017)]